MTEIRRMLLRQLADIKSEGISYVHKLEDYQTIFPLLCKLIQQVQPANNPRRTDT